MTDRSRAKQTLRPPPSPAPASAAESSADDGDDALAPLADALMRVLAAQLEAHRALRRLVDRKRDAIRTADVETIMRTCEEEETLVRGVRDVERQRVAVVGRLSRKIDTGASEPMEVAAIAAALDDSRRGRLERLAARLREEVLVVRRQSEIVASAATALSRHVSGLMQSVYRAVGSGSTYERKGRLAMSTPVDGCIDITS